MKRRIKKKKVSRWSKLVLRHRDKFADLKRALTHQESKEYNKLKKKISKAQKGW